MAWSWEVGADVEEVHQLLLACDRYQARCFAVPAPLRNIASTERQVGAGEVQLLRLGKEPVAMFTLSWQPGLDQDPAPFPPARRPAYLRRLAVSPAWLARGSLAGAQCLRRAVQLATEAGADALRSEANPDLIGPATLLRLFGFQQCGQGDTRDGRRRVYLQKSL